MKEVDEQIRFNVDSSHFLPQKQQHLQQQQQQQQPVVSQANNGRGVGSLDRFGEVREDILQMKNELNALKKDLSSAKRGLEFDKKPLMVSTVKLGYNEHSVIANRFLSRFGYFNTQINSVITYKNGWFRAFRYLHLFFFCSFFGGTG
jgi:hypothetical protein